MLKQYVLKTNLGILGSFLCLGAGLSVGDSNHAAGIILILLAIILWFYGLAMYAREKGIRPGKRLREFFICSGCFICCD